MQQPKLPAQESHEEEIQTKFPRSNQEDHLEDLHRQRTIKVNDDNKSKSQLNTTTKHNIHMFVNSKSGGCSGKKFLQVPDLKIECKLEPTQSKKKKQKKEDEKDENKVLYDTIIYFHDLYNQEQKEGGFKLLNQQFEKGEFVYCIVAGGDGSVLWVVDEMAKAKCETDRIPLGIMPIGTGNDFSRQLGWGPDEGVGKLLGNNYKPLKKLIVKWIESKISNFDLWDFKVEVFEGGYFQKVIVDQNGKNQKVKVMDEKTNQPALTYERAMSNYFSIGIDARIGLGFDKRRQDNRHKNKCIYCLEGVKKFLFLKTPKIQDSLDSLIQVQDDVQEIHSLRDLENQGVRSEVVFSTRSHISSKIINESNSKLQDNNQEQKMSIIKHGKNVTDHKKYLMGTPATLVILNINSYAAGTHGIWKGSNGKYGVKQQVTKNNKEKYIDPTDVQFSEQSFGDKKLEMVSFNNVLNLSAERVLNGQSKRLAQGGGPFIFTYKQFDNKNQLFQTYFQIDGEYFGVKGAKKLVIQQTKKVKGGQIKVLVENSQYAKLFDDSEK